MYLVYRSLIGLLAIILTVCPVYAQTTPAFDSVYGSTGSSDGLFDTPIGIATGTAGNVCVSDLINNRIQKFDSAGNHLLALDSNGSGQSQLITAHGVATDASGNLYVGDTDNHSVHKFDTNGTFIAEFGSAQLSFPLGLR